MISCWEKFGKSKRLSFTFHHQFTFYLRITEQMAIVCVFSVFIKKFTNARDEKWIWHVDPWGMSNIIFRQIFTHSLKQAVWQYAKEKCLMPEIIYILRIIQGDEPKDLKDISRNFWIDHYILVFLLTFRELASISILNYYARKPACFPNQFCSKQRLFL